MRRRTVLWLSVAAVPVAGLVTWLAYAIDNIRESAARAQ